MLSSPDPALTRTEYESVDALPPAALACLGADFFSTADWYRAVLAAAMPPQARPVFLLLSRPTGPVAVFPMLTAGHHAGSLVTPYTCLWQPLLAPGLSDAETDAVWRGFAAWCRRFATIRLDALDAATAAAISAGLRTAGRFAPTALPFEHFGNWHAQAAGGAAAYMGGRPGHVREAIRRRGKRLMANRGRFTIVTSPVEVEAGIAAYETVYAKSWKTPEPYPDFNPTLMRLCAQNGTLRLGLLSQGEAILAAQFWVVRGSWAAVLKLAHDEDSKALSPGTLLTAHMIAHVLTQDGVTALDFGRGDDDYKRSWTDARRQRMGLILANPLRPAGVAAIFRYYAAKVVRKIFFSEEKKQKTFARWRVR
jgi:hypothetical protein